MAGVTINANIVSQILSAALEGRAMLRVWWEPIEWLWVLLWSGIGALLSWRWKHFSAVAVIIVFAAIGLIIVAYLGFYIGWWIPLIPAIFGLIVSAIVLQIATVRELDKIQLRQIVELLITDSKEHPAAVKIAIEYLKQGESQDNQNFIEEAIFNISSKS